MEGEMNMVRMRTVRMIALWVGVAVWCVLATVSVGAGTLDDVKQRGKIIAGVESGTIPFLFLRDGKYVGYDVDLLNIIAETWGMKVEHVDLPWQGILPGLAAKKFDLVATCVTITEQRTKQVLFSVPYSEATTTLLVRKGETRFKKPEDLVGKVIAAQLNSGHHFAVKRLDERLQKETGSGLKEIRTYTTLAEAFLDLANNRVDAAVTSVPIISVLLKEKPGVYEMQFPVAERLYHGWAFRKEDADLQGAVNAIFIELKRNGKIADLQKKWFGFTVETPNDGFEPAKF
jgi:polar amino acid transport system substrate-binding protein